MKEQRKLKFKQIVNKGDLVKVKTLAEHQMETGVRRDERTGVIYPRLIIYKVTARYNGKVVFNELQKSWINYRECYRLYRAAKTKEERKEIKKRIDKLNR